MPIVLFPKKECLTKPCACPLFFAKVPVLQDKPQLARGFSPKASTMYFVQDCTARVECGHASKFHPRQLRSTKCIQMQILRQATGGWKKKTAQKCCCGFSVWLWVVCKEYYLLSWSIVLRVWNGHSAWRSELYKLKGWAVPVLKLKRVKMYVAQPPQTNSCTVHTNVSSKAWDDSTAVYGD